MASYKHSTPVGRAVPFQNPKSKSQKPRFPGLALSQCGQAVPFRKSKIRNPKSHGLALSPSGKAEPFRHVTQDYFGGGLPPTSCRRSGCAARKSQIPNPKSKIQNLPGLPFGSAVGLARPLTANNSPGARFSGRQLNAEFRMRNVINYSVLGSVGTQTLPFDFRTRTTPSAEAAATPPS